VVPLPEVGRTLDVLKQRGIAIAVLTNGWNPMQCAKAQRAGFTDPVLVSSEIGVQKPASAAFEILLRVLGTAPEESWYVGDDPRSDVAAAQAAGMRGVWMNWERKEYPPDLNPPAHTIYGFPELLRLLPSRVRVR
jgi:putative hydrolase of the HAD superfamily